MTSIGARSLAGILFLSAVAVPARPDDLTLDDIVGFLEIGVSQDDVLARVRAAGMEPYCERWRLRRSYSLVLRIDGSGEGAFDSGDRYDIYTPPTGSLLYKLPREWDWDDERDVWTREGASPDEVFFRWRSFRPDPGGPEVQFAMFQRRQAGEIEALEAKAPAAFEVKGASGSASLERRVRFRATDRTFRAREIVSQTPSDAYLLQFFAATDDEFAAAMKDVDALVGSLAIRGKDD
ncbi:MAG: hypothetical protein HY720_31910 [Planctomycetes bacterium]|nr:hypothetical protein [Planctomycetota bacterium]